MALINYRGGFPALNNATRFTMAMPDILPADGCKWPVLWLLGEEGRSSDHYVRNSRIESISKEKGIAVVMPEGLHSDYENMLRGLTWFDYVTEGLPAYIYTNFPVSDAPADNMVFGFGMGGLGAYRFSLRKPGFAKAFGCCRADFDVFSDDEKHNTPVFTHKMETIYGDDFRSEEVLNNSDPYRMAASSDGSSVLVLIGNCGNEERISQILSDRGNSVVICEDADPENYDCAILTFLSRCI